MIGQNIDHWETIVNNDDTWHYKIGDNSIPENWNEASYDIEDWTTGPGGFGYGDNDDNTLLPNALSVFFRTSFDVSDPALIRAIVLHADYDDGFVAYLNGVEVARANINPSFSPPSYLIRALEPHEAGLYRDVLPESFSIPASQLISGTNVLAIQVHNVTPTSSDLSSNFFLSAGIATSDALFGPTPAWFDLVNFSTGLAIVKITTQNNQAIPDEPRINAHMEVIYNGDGNTQTPLDPPNEYNGDISIEIRGTSSQLYEKKSYGFETRQPDGSNNNVSLLGLPKENDWILYGPYADKSLLRNVLTYQLGRRTGQYAPRTRYCELFINGAYMGIYVLTEKIKQDKNRVDISALNPDENTGDDLTGGYIIKVDRNDGNIPGTGWYSSFPDYKFFAYVDPKDDDISSAQQNYIQDYMYFFESAMQRSDYDEIYTNFIDIRSWVDYFLVTEISKHIDAYKLSFYMYKDKDSKGGKLHCGPLWDINFGYGNFNFDCYPGPEGWAYEFPDCGSWHPFWTQKINDIPNVQHLAKCRWEELRSGPFSRDSIMAFIDAQVAMMGKAIDRNFERWPVLGQYVWANDFIGETYEEELDFLRDWITSRLFWMDYNIAGDCSLYTTDTKEVPDVSFSVFPNPARESVYISMELMPSDTYTAELYDMDGRLLQSQQIRDHQSFMSLANFPEGIYFIAIRKDGVNAGSSVIFKQN